MCIVCAYPHHLLLLHHDIASRVLWNVYRVCLPPSLAVAAPWRCQPITMKCVSCVLTPITCCCCTMTLPTEYYEMCIVCAYPHHLLLLHHDVASIVLWNVYRVRLPPSLAVPWRCQPSTMKCVSCVLTPITCCCCTMTLPAEYYVMCIVCLPPSLAVAAPWRCQPSTMKCVSCALTPITCCCCTMTLPAEYYEMCIVCAYPHHLLLLHHDVASRVLCNVYCVLTPITCCCCTMTLPAEYYEMCIVCLPPSLAVAAPWRCQPSTM